MKSTDTQRLHPRIDRKLARVARSSPVPAWHGAWSGLGPHSTDEERLRVCRAIREAGALSEDAGYFLVSWAAEKLADDEVTRLSDPLRTLNIFEGGRVFKRILGDLLEGHGEAGMANLFRTNPEEHDRRREAGRLFFFKPDDQGKDDATGWLDGLLRAVAAKVIASKPVAGLAYRYCPDAFVLQLHVCLPAGADGPAATGWAVDIDSLREAFDKIDGCGWYAVPAEDGERPYFWIEGKFAGREVFLRLLPDVAEAAGERKGWEVWKKP